MKTILSTAKRQSIPLFLSCLVVLMCLISCKKDDETVAKVSTGEAKIRIINASHSGASVDFYLDKNKINSQSLAVGEASGYIKVSSGLQSATFSTGGSVDVTANVNYIPTFSYTSFYIEDKAGKGEMLTFEDDLGATEAGRARVRFINLSPYFTNSLNINLSGNTLLVNSLAFKEASMYFSIDPNADLSISVLGAAGAKIVNGTEFEPGKIYTIWLSGTSNSKLSINKITYN